MRSPGASDGGILGLSVQADGRPLIHVSVVHQQGSPSDPDQLSDLLKFSASSAYLMIFAPFPSSANFIKNLTSSMNSSMSSMCIVKRHGPRTVPWGTPDSTSSSPEWESPILTDWTLRNGLKPFSIWISTYSPRKIDFVIADFCVLTL
jgi:hypothetical protein